LGLKYIELAPGFVREVVDIYQAWEGKESIPMKVQELMMVLRIEVFRRYSVDVFPKGKPKTKQFKDIRIGRFEQFFAVKA
jgi:hypothetical protein